MKEQISLLETIGLTELEAQVYLYFLENGQSKVTQVYKALKTDKSSTYRVIENLSKRGLLIGLGEEYGKQFIVSDPNLLIELAKKKQEDLEVASDAISKYISALTQDKGELFKRENITIYEGQDAYRKIMQKRLDEKAEVIREISNAKIVADNVEGYWEYMEYFIPRRVKLGIKHKSIVMSADKNRKYEKSDPKLLKEVKYISGKPFASTIVTFNDYTSIYNEASDRKLGILIKDKMIAQTIEVFFDVLWNYLPN